MANRIRARTIALGAVVALLGGSGDRYNGDVGCQTVVSLPRHLGDLVTRPADEADTVETVETFCV